MDKAKVWSGITVAIIIFECFILLSWYIFLRKKLTHTRVKNEIVSKDLKRIKYGDMELGQLAPGKWRYLKKDELDFCGRVVSQWEDDGAGWDKSG